MQEFHSTLLREKFVIHDLAREERDDNSEPVIALSNRLILPLISSNGQIRETFIIRSQNMYTAARYGAYMAKEFFEKGPIMKRVRPLGWDEIWNNVIKGYERQWNPDRWCAIYYKGRSVFDAGKEHHPFLDIIEQCDAHNKGEYEDSIQIAQDAFAKAGKKIEVEYDSNIAILLTANKQIAKCGIIARGPDRKTTFNYTVRKTEKNVVRVSQCLDVAANFLEGIQLTFVSGMTRQKLSERLIGPDSDLAKKGHDATYKLGRLDVAINQFENMMDVTYKPERPKFSEMIEIAEQYAQDLYENNKSETMS